jgi:Ran GTPase-activating protein (RanGAP) involved in mRNA processing and transport
MAGDWRALSSFRFCPHSHSHNSLHLFVRSCHPEQVRAKARPKVKVILISRSEDTRYTVLIEIENAANQTSHSQFQTKGEQRLTNSTNMSGGDDQRLEESVFKPIQENRVRPFLLDLGVLFPQNVRKYLPDIKAMLEGTSSLKTLSFCGTQARCAGVIRVNHRTEFLLFSFFESLGINKSLHTLNLERCQLIDEHISRLMKYVKESKSLKYLDLTANAFQNLEPIADALSSPGFALQELNLSSCIGEDRKQWKLLSEALKRNSSLTSLKLFNCDLQDDQNCVTLVQCLEKNQSIRYLDLCYCKIQENGGKALITMLGANKSLMTIDLEENELSGTAFAEFGSSMEKNCSLEALLLGKNPLKDEGAIFLAQGLKNNSTLTNLRLFSNSIGDAGAKQLFDSLKNGKSALQNLNLYQNEITDEGLKYICNFLSFVIYARFEAEHISEVLGLSQ